MPVTITDEKLITELAQTSRSISAMPQTARHIAV